MQRKKALVAAPQLVETIIQTPSAGRQHKRQRTALSDTLQLVSVSTTQQPQCDAEQERDSPIFDHQLSPPSAADLSPMADQEAAEDSSDVHTSSTIVSDTVHNDEPTLLPPHSAATPASPTTISQSPRSSDDTEPSSAVSIPSRRSAPSLHGDMTFLSAEQRRRREFIERTVNDCLQMPDHFAAEPTRAQLAALIHPSAAIRPPLLPPPRAPTPSTPSKRRSATSAAVPPRTPASSIAALSAAVSFSTGPSPSFLHLPLPLPVQYRFLLSMFSALECAITVRVQSSVLWSVLSPAIIRIVQKSVTLSHLQQLAALVPDCYELREERSVDGWGRVKVDVRVSRLRLGGEREVEIGGLGGSSAASSAELKERRHLLEQRLLDRAIDEHAQWYSSTPDASQQPYDPVTEGHWHTEFPLDSLPSLPKAEIKGSLQHDKMSAHDALESLSGHKRKWEDVEPLTPRSSVSRSSSNASELLLLTPSTRSSSQSSTLSLLDTPVSQADHTARSPTRLHSFSHVAYTVTSLCLF